MKWTKPSLGLEEKNAIDRIVERGWFTQGPETKRFEQELCDYIGCKYAIVVNNGTSALITALLAHGIKANDEVVVPTFSFIASINAIIAIGAKPVLVDCDRATWNTTPDLVKEKLTNKTKAIMPVDVAGMPIDIDAFEELASKRGLILIEDSAEALGAMYKNKKIGSFNHTSVFSFHMAKQLTTIEGGCIVTNDKEVAERCYMIRNHGFDLNKRAEYIHRCFGLNFRITDLQAAIGREQLKKLDDAIKHRNKLVQIYREELDFELQQIPDYVSLHPYMFFGILTENREKLVNRLLENNIEVKLCWLPAHMQPYHSKIFDSNYENAEYIYSRILCLPMGNAITEEDIKKVIEVIKNVKN